MENIEVRKSPIHGPGVCARMVLQMQYLPLLDKWFVDGYKVKVDRLQKSIGNSIANYS
jgi:hypothetical protein